MDWLTTDQAARELALTPGWIVRLINAGKLPAKQAGRTWVIDRKDWENFKAQERRPCWQPGRKRKSN